MMMIILIMSITAMMSIIPTPEPTMIGYDDYESNVIDNDDHNTH